MQALGILAAAFKSKTVLTDVFMLKKNARGGKREAPEEVMPCHVPNPGLVATTATYL
jgi:hypothetical protein